MSELAIKIISISNIYLYTSNTVIKILMLKSIYIKQKLRKKCDGQQFYQFHSNNKKTSTHLKSLNAKKKDHDIYQWKSKSWLGTMLWGETGWLIDDWFIVFNATFSNISAISWCPVLVVEEAGVSRENHRPWASNWSTLLPASRVHPFCNLQSRARTHAVLVIGLYDLLGNPTT